MIKSSKGLGGEASQAIIDDVDESWAEILILEQAEADGDIITVEDRIIQARPSAIELQKQAQRASFQDGVLPQTCHKPQSRTYLSFLWHSIKKVKKSEY